MSLYFTHAQTRTTPTQMLAILAALLLCSLTACASKPFARHTVVPLGVTSPQQVLDKLAIGLPTSIVTDDTVIIEAPFRDDMAVLSVVKIDRINVTLELMGMSHTGVKLFHVAYQQGKPIIRYAAPPLKDKKQILESLATDSWHIYFDLLPELNNWKKTSWDDMTFERKTSNGTLKYTVARIAPDQNSPARTVLTQKKLSTWSGTKWRVRYYHYAPQSAPNADTDIDATTEANANADTKGAAILDQRTSPQASANGNAKLHPAGIVLDNETYHYRIIVKNRNWREVSP